MVYIDRLCIDFGGQKQREVCHSSNDIGRTCNMSHAEQVAGRNYGHGFFFSFLFFSPWLELTTLEFERFFTNG